RYLSSLAKHELVERDPQSGQYRLGLNLFRLGSRALRQRDIGLVAGPLMDRLCETFGETVNLAARQRNQVMVIRIAESANSLRKGSRPGEVDSWHATALGKAFLAALPEAAATDILGSITLTDYTP